MPCFWIVVRRRLNYPFTGQRLKSARDDELPLSSNQNAAPFCRPMSVREHQTLSPSFILPCSFLSSLFFSLFGLRAFSECLAAAGN